MSKTQSNVTTDFVLPIVVLVLICAVMSGLLAVTNNITAPIIEEAERRAAEEARKEVLSAADSFVKVENAAGLPDAVTEVYKAANGAGYTFSITAQGYGGKNTLKLTVGIDADGKITGTKVLGHEETAGLGSKITTDAFQGQFPGQDAGYVSDIKNIDTISGATKSSNFFRLALTYAFQAYDLVKEGA